MINEQQAIQIGIGVIIGAVGIQFLLPKPQRRRTMKEINMLKEKAENKGYFEGYEDGKKDFKPKKKRKKK